MIVDLHNHTSLCNHATGTIEEYIEKAIEKKIDIYGFSDHAPMVYEPEYRMSFDEMAKYESLIRDAKHQYEGSIDIRLGYEVDYGEGFLDPRVLEADVDYLIGSVHFIHQWGFDNPAYLGLYSEKDPNETWKEYFGLIESMAQTGYFQIIGHLDLLKVYNFFPTEDALSLANHALQAIKDNGCVIEVNTAGLRKPVKQIYPSLEFIQEAIRREIPLTLSSDAHSPTQVGEGLHETQALLARLGVKKIAHFCQKELFFCNFD